MSETGHLLDEAEEYFSHNRTLPLHSASSVASTRRRLRIQNGRNGHITATREGAELKQQPIDGKENPSAEVAARNFGTDFPEKVLVTDVRYEGTRLECWNVRAVPGRRYPREKIAIFEHIFNQIENEGEKLRILAGDLNSPKRELADGQAVTYGYHRSESMQREAMTAELRVLKGLSHFGVVDIFRALHGYGEIDQVDVSHDGRRIDHLYASEKLSPSKFWYPPLEEVPSDHAPLIAEFNLFGS